MGTFILQQVLVNLNVYTPIEYSDFEVRQVGRKTLELVTDLLEEITHCLSLKDTLEKGIDIVHGRKVNFH